MDPPEPFANLAENCHPIASKSRPYRRDDLKFIEGEVERLLKEGIIEPSNSPWRAQVVVTKDDNHKKRLAIDYSQTINRFTQLDAFRLPRINDLVNDIAQYQVFSQGRFQELSLAIYSVKFDFWSVKLCYEVLY